MLEIKLSLFKYTIFYLKIGGKNETNSVNTIQKAQIQEVKPYAGRIRKDLNAKHKEEERKNKPKKIKCPTCGGVTYEDDIYICAKCGTKVCSNCGSYDTITHKHYCNDCWKEL